MRDTGRAAGDPPATGWAAGGRAGTGAAVTVGAEPVEAFLDALLRADLWAVEAALAPDAVLDVPSLDGRVVGRDRILQALGAVLTAFPDLHYASSGRYVAPTEVTDEVVLSGTRLGPWGRLAASGRQHALPARVVFAHDGAAVTGLTLWADPAALRALVLDGDEAGAAAGTAAAGIVSALRATIPASDPRVILAADREEGPAAVATHTPTHLPVRGGELNAAAAKAAALRVPLPRRARRLLVLAATVSMAFATVSIVAWVTRGALSSPPGTVGLVARTSPAVTPSTPAPRPAPRTPTATATARPSFVQDGNLFTLSTDLTFDSGSARLTPQASQVLAEIIAQVRRERRRGTVVVNGFTDSVGTRGDNLRLSRDRAGAVAAVLRDGLAGQGLTVRSSGYGEDRQKATNRTAAGRALNRRVEITVPNTR